MAVAAREVGIWLYIYLQVLMEDVSIPNLGTQSTKVWEFNGLAQLFPQQGVGGAPA